jgi:hypothetical protein
MSRDMAYVIGEVELLRGTDSVDSIATRVGYSNRYSLARQLSRWGRDDLAALFGKGTRVSASI